MQITLINRALISHLHLNCMECTWESMLILQSHENFLIVNSNCQKVGNPKKVGIFASSAVLGNKV